MKAIVLVVFLSFSFSAGADSEGLTPLHLAAGAGDLKLVEKLLLGGADLFTLDTKMGVSVLHKAVYSGNSQVIEMLLKSGALINLQSPSNGDTPLHDAIYFRQGDDLSVIQTLLVHKPNISIRNRAGLTPIESAKVLRANDIVQILENYEQSRQSPESQKLRKATRDGKPDQVELLLESVKKDVLFEADDQGFTPLLWAAREGNTEIVKLLLKFGSDPNQKDQWMGANSGHKAGFWGRAEVMSVLIASGLDVNARGDYNGYTPLHDAVARGHIEVIKILLAGGARKDIKGHDAKTAVDLANASKNPAVIKLLNEDNPALPIDQADYP